MLTRRATVERMRQALEEIASEGCTYAQHGWLPDRTLGRDEFDPTCPGEVCTAKRGLGFGQVGTGSERNG